MRCGGIIADVMGLGKTLTVLASILRSIPDAEVFQKFDRPISKNDKPSLRTKATLIVVSSARELTHMLKALKEALISWRRAAR